MTTLSRAMSVRRVITENGSHIEPDLDETWTARQQLCWMAGVVEADCPGLRVSIGDGKATLNSIEQRGYYSISISHPRGSSGTVMRFDRAWRHLASIAEGYGLAQKVADSQVTAGSGA